MKNWKKRLICFSVLLLNLFFCSSVCLANDDQTYVEEENFDVFHFLDHAKVIDDKIYVQSDNIYFSSNQIYVRILENLIPIQNLSCDYNGIFVSIQDIQAGRGRQDIWPCPRCGYENYVGIDNCGQCGRNRYEKDGLGK